MVEVLF